MRAGLRAFAKLPQLPWVASFMLAACALGSFRLGEKGLWVDEAVSLRFALQAKATWFEDHNMALFYALLSAVVRVFGKSETALRSLSVACFVASVAPFYALLSRAFEPKVARIGCALFVANAFVVHFAQEARGYMLALLLVTTASWLLLRLVEAPSRRAALAYGTVMGLALYAHAFSLWVLLAHACAAFWLVFRVRRPVRELALGFLVAGLFALPLVMQAISAGTTQISWLKRPTLASCAALFGLFAGDSTPLAVGYGLAWLGFVAIGMSAIRSLAFGQAPALRSVQRGFAYVLVAAWFAVPVVVTLAISLLATPIVHPKYLLVALPGLLAGVAVCLARVRSPALFCMLGALFLSLSGSSLHDWYTGYEKERWREAVAFLREHWQANDALVLDLRAAEAFDYYVLSAPPRQRLPTPLVPERAWSLLWGEWREPRAPSERERAARLAAAPRIWLVRNRSNDAALRAQIMRHHPQVTTIKLEPRDGDERALFASAEGRIIYVESFRRRDAAQVLR